MPERPTIVLAIDGLRASALGAYGNTWRSTPAFDRLACESLLVEWAFACAPSPRHFYERLAPLAGAYPRRKLVTDQAAVAADGGGFFGETTVLETPGAAAPAESTGDTLFAEVFARFADAAAELADQPSGGGLLWLHTRGFGGPWDAPTPVIRELVEEDDPEPPVSVVPKDGPIDPVAEPDARFVAACRYAAQVAVLDACLGAWLDAVDDRLRDAPPRVVLLGLRGYALGEHGACGIESPAPYNEARHVPLLIRDGAAVAPGRRWAKGLVPLSATPNMLAMLAHDESEPPKPAAYATDAAVDAAACGALTLRGAGATGLRTADWCLIAPHTRDEPAELYVKPDDRWDANNVASRAADIVDELLPRIRGVD